MSIPLSRSNLYRYLMNVINDADKVIGERDDEELDRHGYAKFVIRELAIQLIEDFELAPKPAGRQ